MIKLLSLLIILLIIAGFIPIDAAPESEIWNNDNIAPTIDLNVTPAKKPVDIVILTDYTDKKLTALNVQINALKAQFSAVNVDPKFHIISDIKNIGTQNDELYEFVRYGRFDVTYSHYEYYFDYGVEEEASPYTNYNEVEWEKITALKSQLNDLPARNPKNVYFTKGPLKEIDEHDLKQKWHDIYIKCANDPSHFEDQRIMEYVGTYISIGNHNRRKVYGSIISEVASVDSTWTMKNKISDVSYDIYSFDFDKLNAVALREGSDRHLVFLSDAAAKDYSKTFGNYFSFGDMTDTLKAYIKTNNFSLYGIVPDYAKDRTLYPDKAMKILPLGHTTLFYMRNGCIQRLGSAKTASLLDDGSKMYPLNTNETYMGDIKDVISGNNVWEIYYLMEDGTIKYYDSSEDAFVNYTGFPDNITKLCYYSRFSSLALDSNGKIYELDFNANTATCYNNSTAITDIKRVGSEFIFLTETGVPYIKYDRYDTVNRVYTYNLLRRLQILTVDEDTEEETISNMPNLKDAEYFTARARLNSLNPMLFLYTTGKIQQYSDFDTRTVYSGTNSRYENYIKYLLYEPNSIMETGAGSIESCDTGIFIYKADGTVKLLNCDYVEETGRIKEDDGGYEYITYMRPYLKNSTVTASLANIRKTQKTEHYYYFITDANDDTYMYYGTCQGLEPALGTTMTGLGKVKKIVETDFNHYHYIFILYYNGTARQIRYWNSLVNNEYRHYYTNTLLPYTDIKDIYSSDVNVYLLKEDGHVLGMGNSAYGQLGIKSNGTINAFKDPFPTTLTFDETKEYYSLLDLFNEIPNGRFYPAGGYAAAFGDIYKNYSYSTGGDMYVVLGDDIRYESSYDDYEKDPEYSRKWLISHDPYYFDNSMGLSAYHKPAGFTASPPVKLDKTGRYVINLKARDNPKSNLKFLSDSNEDKNYYKWSLGNHNLTVYVHRRPVALQSIDVTNNGDGTYTVRAYDAGSYDPDHSNSRPDRGIAAREWRWKEKTSTVWTAGQMNKSDCTPDESYITQLRVKDVEGVWSDYATITIDRNNPPIALFNIDKNVINISELLKVKDESYPQSLSEIILWHWTVKKLNADGSVPAGNIQDAQFTNSNAGTGGLAGFDSNVKTNYSNNGTGKYRIYLRVKDSNGLWSDEFSRDIEVDRPPVADFAIEKNPIFVEEALRLKDLSTASGTSPLAKWHWTVKKLNQDGTVPVTSLQDEEFEDSNTGTGEMEGCDVNVKTHYADKGAGTYRIYLRVMNGNGIWSEGEKYEDLVVQESFKMSGFRVVRIRDLHLEPYYESDGKYIDRPFYVDSMAIDPENFMAGGTSLVPGFSSLTKGYRFEFEIDSVNFNEADDSINVTPAFFPYTTGIPGVRGPEADLYWEDSDKVIHKAGEGGHSKWAEVTLDSSNRTITGENSAVWRGEYFIPATSWLVPQGTSVNDAKSEKINADIIVNFAIKGYRNGELKYDYNLQQWPEERTAIKNPYEIGDVIRYDYTKSSLEDIDIIINRP